MIHRSLAAVSVALMVLPSTPAQEKSVRPKGPVPLFFIVTAVNADGLVVEPVPLPTKEVFPEKIVYRPAFKGMDATNPKGQKLTRGEVAKRLKPGSVILVNVDETPVDPAYLAILKDDTVIL